jgi:hypothetical protein
VLVVFFFLALFFGVLVSCRGCFLGEGEAGREMEMETRTYQILGRRNASCGALDSRLKGVYTMSEKKERFTWSAQEKDWLKTWQPKLRRDLRKLGEQVKRFEQAIPTLAVEAKEAADPFLTHGWKLLELSWKNKYNQLSREEAESEYKKINEKFDVWAAFVGRKDVSSAVREVNRTVQVNKRDYQKALRDAEDQIRAYACEPAFDKLIQKDVEAVEDGVRMMAQLTMTLKKVGTDQEIPILERLILLAFVRTTYDFNRQKSDAMREILTANPPATTRDLLACTVKVLRIDAMLHRLIQYDDPSARGSRIMCAILL